MKFTPIHFGFYDPDFFIARHDHINYFEAIVAPDGQLTYACPSHQEALIRITGLPRDVIWEIIRPEDDVMKKLMEITRCVPLYSNGYIRPISLYVEQERTLQKLFAKGLVKPVELGYW